jgi:V/A-type H+-transporting ATPase subunit K
MKSRLSFTLALVALTGLLAASGTVLLALTPSALAAETAGAGGATAFGNAGYGFLAAAISTALAALGAGFAVAKVGAAAIGALAEKPELFGRLLIFVGLAEGIAIYGLIVSILILNRLG